MPDADPLAPPAHGEDQGTAADGLPLFYELDRRAWRAWLGAHHATARGVWLVY